MEYPSIKRFSFKVAVPNIFRKFLEKHWWQSSYSAYLRVSICAVLIDFLGISPKFSEYFFQRTQLATQPTNIGPQDVLRTSPSNFPRTSPKDPIWLSQGRPNLTSRGRHNLTSWGRLNLTFKGRSWEVDLGLPQDVLSTFPRGPWEYSNLDV